MTILFDVPPNLIRFFGPIRHDLVDGGKHLVVHRQIHPKESPYAGMPSLWLTVLPDPVPDDFHDWGPYPSDLKTWTTESPVLAAVLKAIPLMDSPTVPEAVWMPAYLAVCQACGFDPNWKPGVTVVIDELPRLGTVA